MIDIDTGDLVLDSGNVIGRKMTKSGFVKSDLYSKVKEVQDFSWTNYCLFPQSIGDSQFVIVIFFNPQGRLAYVKLGLSQNGELQTWDQWSEQKELELKQEHDNWLRHLIGPPPYEYEWGAISSSYDPRSGSSMITIRYK